MAPCAFNGCCIDLVAFKMFHRQSAIWMGDLSALINKLLGTSLQTGCQETLRNQKQPRRSRMCCVLCMHS